MALKRVNMSNNEFSLKFNTDDVIAILKANLVEHNEMYNEALEGWRSACIKRFDELSSLFKSESGAAVRRSLSSVFSNLSPPVSHADCYASSIYMLELTNESEITLTQDQFERFIMDKWWWKKSFNRFVDKYVCVK